MGRYADIQDSVKQLLRNHSEAASYLNEALKVGDTSTFLSALRDVIEANTGTMAKVAQVMNLRVEHLELLLWPDSNPELTGIDVMLDAIGFTFVIQEKRKSSH